MFVRKKKDPKTSLVTVTDILWPLIYVKGIFCAALFSLRGHLQTRGHRRVFEQTSINVAAPSGETTVLGLSATFKWHEKLNSCPSLAEKKRLECFGVVSRDAHRVLAEMMSWFLFKMRHTDTAGRPTKWSIQHVRSASTRMSSDSCTYAFLVP